MKIIVLTENTSKSSEFECEHGLSLYIETKQNKVLFDTGASSLFSRNASKFNIDLSDINDAVISHGHYDHGGGLKTFLDYNNTANVYINKNAFEDIYSDRNEDGMVYIGLDKSLENLPQIKLIDDKYTINNEFEIFVANKTNYAVPNGNKTLYIKSNETYINDDFRHEHNLVITEGSKKVLISGCSHKGILNILDSYYEIYNSYPDCVIGGFHLSSKKTGISESDKDLNNLAKKLLETDIKFYTCHCTGIEAYNKLKIKMDNNIEYVSAGTVLEF